MAITRVELPTIAELAADYCEDMRRLKIRAGIANPNVAPGSETAMTGEATASVAFQLHAEIAATQDATMEDSANGDDLIRLAKIKRDMDPRLGAGAQGNVTVSCTGAVTYPKDLECKAADGLRYKVVTSMARTNGQPLPVTGIDTGKRTDKLPGAVMTWSSPPAGSATTAVVDASGLNNGIDPDNDARLRARLLDSIRHPGASGSWAHYVEWAEQNMAVEKAFCVPAPSGPGTVRVIYTVVADKDNLTGAYTREGSTALTAAVALNVVAQDPEHADVPTTTVADSETTLYLRIKCPLAVEDGGPGGGWIDGLSTRWPSPVAPYTTVSHLNAPPTVPTAIQVDCLDAGANPPLVDAHITIWSTSAKKFVHGQILSATLVAGNVYNLVLHEPIDTSIITTDDPISPDAESMDDYGDTIARAFGSLGPGELTTNALLLPRSARHPLATESWNSMLTSVHVGMLPIEHPEVTHVTCDVPTLPALPAPPATVNDPPGILVLGKLAIYKKN
ncbi:MAG: baseplate J/gp47 family protein [Brevundimonas sp.]